MSEDQDDFLDILKDPHAFLQQSKLLKKSSDLLQSYLMDLIYFSEVNMHDKQNDYRETQLALMKSHLLLLGLAFENLIKGISVLLFNDFSSFNELKQKYWKISKGHEIYQLAQNIGIILNEQESFLLDRLEQFILWAGRYPTPTTKEVYLTNFIYNNKLWFLRTDPEVSNMLFDRLIRDYFEK